MLRMQWWMRPGPRRACAISKPRPFAEQDVLDRDAHVLEVDLGVSVGRVVEAEDRKHAEHVHARRVDRDDDLQIAARVLPV